MTNNQNNQHPLPTPSARVSAVWRPLLTAAFLSCTLVLSLAVSWLLLASVNFLYPAWYELLDIDETVRTHAPLNESRPDFPVTDQVEHHRLFAEMLTSVNSGGEGLSAIRYESASGNGSHRLLTGAEIDHLGEVAALVTILYRAAALATILIPGLLLLAAWSGVRLAPMRHVLVFTLAGISVGGIVVVLIGPVDVFYAAHDWLFPPDKQWFFYYEESLMTTLMQAPNLFLPTGVSWLVLSVVLWAGLWRTGERILAKHSSDETFMS